MRDGSAAGPPLLPSPPPPLLLLLLRTSDQRGADGGATDRGDSAEGGRGARAEGGGRGEACPSPRPPNVRPRSERPSAAPGAGLAVGATATVAAV
jgi:hypothetical protein